MFMIEDKICLITGAATGIGLEYVKALFRQKLKGVTIADIDTVKGQKAVEELNKEFGPNKAIFVKTDVRVKSEFEDAFKKTIEKFKQLDIVINNAGILNDAIWETEIAINCNAVVVGSMLALEEYLPKYRSTKEGVLINIASIVGLSPFSGTPVYSASKHFVVGLSRSFGNKFNYDRTNVKVITVCPGVTETTLFDDVTKKGLTPDYGKYNTKYLELPPQSAKYMGESLVKIITEGKSGSVWVTEGGNPTKEVKIPFNYCE